MGSATIARNIQIKDQKLFELKFNLASKSRLRGNFRQHIEVEVANGQTMNISMPKQVLIKDFLYTSANPFEKSMISENGRLIMSDKLVIQLNSELDEVQNIGCFYYWKDNSFINYNFLSLLDNEQRHEITRLMRTQPHAIVEFNRSSPPISPHINKNVIYTTKMFDMMTGETSIIKINLETMSCYEIYQSKFNLIHFAMFENKSSVSDLINLPNKPKKISKNDLFR